MMPKTKVAVIGGGIIGLSSALSAIESLEDVDVTIIASELSPFTTGDGSAGFWNPYLIGKVPLDTFRYWCKETFEFLLKLSHSADASKCGVGLLSAYYLSTVPIPEDAFQVADIFLECRPIKERELSMFPCAYRYGIFLTTLYAQCTKLLPYLMNKFTEKGGKVLQRRINSLSELAGIYDVVINCPGVEAAKLAADPDVKPIRGQVFRVNAPWIKHAVIAEDKFHILPNVDNVVCGGTHQVNDWNRNIDLEDRKNIWAGCCSLIPSLQNADIVKEWVGLRPGRSSPRIEHDIVKNSSGKTVQVIHNYGHGGSGVTLFWGCAKQTTQLLHEAMIKVKNSKL